ncbi:hypothetical protein [Deinococcus sonorensis]|uniref:HTH hxlR-type domain-containing protein n=2 Tax=Deinococcus sonorensis TaxID=309891 RepID=A0AAU7U4D5_9DEIO
MKLADWCGPLEVLPPAVSVTPVPDTWQALRHRPEMRSVLEVVCAGPVALMPLCRMARLDPQVASDLLGTLLDLQLLERICITVSPRRHAYRLTPWGERCKPLLRSLSLPPSPQAASMPGGGRRHAR